MNGNQVKRIRRLSEMSHSEIIRQIPSIKESSKEWKKVLGSEWMWFASIITGSWLLSNIFEFYLPARVEKLTIIILVLLYATRLTIWSIKEMGKE